MFTSARLEAHDVMDKVVVTITVWQHDGMSSLGPESRSWHVTFPGEGEPKLDEWMRDVLVAAIETV